MVTKTRLGTEFYSFLLVGNNTETREAIFPEKASAILEAISKVAVFIISLGSSFGYQGSQLGVGSVAYQRLLGGHLVSVPRHVLG